MKKLILSITLLFVLLIPAKHAIASHIVAGSINYFYIAPNTYLVRLYLYRDCVGIPAPTSPVICYSSQNCGYGDSVVLSQFGAATVLPHDSCLPGGGLSSCLGGTAYGIEEHIYQDTIVLPFACTDWKFSYTIFSSTMYNPQTFYVEAILDNLNFSINTSAFFNEYPQTQFCVGNTTVIDFNCSDPDGDSLFYQLDTVFENANLLCPPVTTPMLYFPGYSPFNPLTSATGFIINAIGKLYFYPTAVEIDAVKVKVSEYRNGVLVGNIMRQLMVKVEGTCTLSCYPYLIVGKSFFDYNVNGVMDAGDVAANNVIIQEQPLGYVTVPDLAGDYMLGADTGNYIITVPNPPKYHYSFPFQNTAYFTSLGQVDSMNDFIFYPINGISDLRITVSTDCAPIAGNVSHCYITTTNMGTDTLNPDVQFIHDSLLTYQSSTPAPTSQSGDTITWSITNLYPAHSTTILLDLNVDSTATIGSIVSNNASVFPVVNDSFPADNYFSFTQTVVNSCDPNYKEVNPQGNISTTQVASGDYMEYTIHFQNTGTSTCYKVIIKDTLSDNVVANTFEVLAWSHNYYFTVSGKGIITFHFPNINLPDSAANEPASHGFIHYRVRLKNTLVPGNTIENTAYIYFDNNAAIITNTTQNVVVNVQSISSITGNNNLLIYPNPATDEITISSRSKQFIKTIALYDVTGRLMSEKNISSFSNSHHYDVSKLNNGIYLLKIFTADDAYVYRVVKQ